MAELEDEEGKTCLLQKAKSGVIHNLNPLIERFSIRKRLITGGVFVFKGVFVKDTRYFCCLNEKISLDFLGAHD